MRQAVSVAETVNSSMLQKPSDNRFHPDVFRQAGQPGPQAADTTHHEIDLHTGPRCRVEIVDNLRIDQRIHLHPDRRRPSGLGVGNFLRNMVTDARAQVGRRDGEPFQLRRLRIPGDEIEDAAHVARDHRIGGEERQVGIDPRRHRVVIAGADVHVAGERPAFAPHHERELGVSFQLDEAKHHLCARPLQVACPADVGLLVEPRLEFHQGGDRFSRLGRLAQRPHDGRLGRGSI